MISFLKNNIGLILKYSSQHGDDAWIRKELATTNSFSISSKSFIVSHKIWIDPDTLQTPANPESLLSNDSKDLHFLIGRKYGEYYRIDRSVLDIEFDLCLHDSLKFERRFFVAERNIPIFRHLNDFGLQEIFIGGSHPNALMAKTFELLLKKFPNTYELNRYADARVSGIIREFLPIQRDFEAKYQRYLNKKASRSDSDLGKLFAPFEADKYSDLISRIETMLTNPDSYNEHNWQVEILQVILFLFPKYIASFREAPIWDSLAKKDRSIDFLLVDASGYIDGIEIKKPFASCMVTTNRYRDNHVPMRELNGTVMQIEKYLFHLNRWGQQGETILNKRYESKLPSGIRLQIVNPSGMIIMGRDIDWTQDQRTDFEIIRRKYRHVLEIMTYDDLLRRLKTIRNQFIAIASNSIS